MSHDQSLMDYRDFVLAMDRADLILTDSGGVQEEAPSLPVLVLREITERPEAIEAGTARLVGTDAQRIVEEAAALLRDPERYRAATVAVNPYGDGKATARILDVLAGVGPPEPRGPRARRRLIRARSYLRFRKRTAAPRYR